MDPVRTEVMRNRFAAIVSEASYVAYRCAHTTFVKEVQDYQVAIAGLSGEFFGWPTESGTSTGTTQTVMGLVNCIGKENLKEGDIIIANDPFSGGGIVTHSMDINLLMPIFYKGTLVSYAWAFIHASDIGGAVPGSIAPTNYEIYQEGFRIKPTFLYKDGVFNEQLWALFRDNTRIPELIWGDLQAMIAGMRLLENRMHDICDRYGMEETLGSIEDVLELADQKARQAIGRLKNGVYEAHDYLESFEEGGHVFIKCKLIVEDEKLTLDFDGTDPQVNYSMNFPSGDGSAHSHLGWLITQYIRSVEPTAPVNGGLLRSVRTLGPKGSIVNAEFPAAGGNRSITINRCYDTALYCLNQAMAGGGLSAAGAGTVGVLSVSSVDPATGRRRVSVVDPFMGGGGGRNGLDGNHGSHSGFGFLKSVPIETVEGETGLIIRYFGYQRDTAAPGEYRGGSSIRIDLQNTGTPAVVTCRGLDRFRFQPWGINGGKCGSQAQVVLNPETDKQRDIGKIDVLQIMPGDVLRMVSPSGGGYGDPYARPVDSVVADVVDNVISVEVALAEYGVIVEGTGRALTGRRVRDAGETGMSSYSLGAERVLLEETWPADVSAELAREMLKSPPALRNYWISQIRTALAAKGSQVTMQDLNGEIARLREIAA